MTNPNDSPVIQRRLTKRQRIVAGFLLAALATYIPIAVYVVFLSWNTNHPGPGTETWGAGIGEAIMLIWVGPFCSLVTGIVCAFLAGYRRVHLGRMVFYLLVGWSLAMAAVHALN